MTTEIGIKHIACTNLHSIIKHHYLVSRLKCGVCVCSSGKWSPHCCELNVAVWWGLSVCGLLLWGCYPWPLPLSISPTPVCTNLDYPVHQKAWSDIPWNCHVHVLKWRKNTLLPFPNGLGFTGTLLNNSVLPTDGTNCTLASKATVSVSTPLIYHSF